MSADDLKNAHVKERDTIRNAKQEETHAWKK
jgi:hypothetical protein